MRAVTLFCLTLFALPALAGNSLDADFERMMQWFPGKYDNTEQAEADKAAGLEQVHEHIFHIFMPVSAPAIGDTTVFVKQYMDGDYENVYRQRLYSFTKDEEKQAIKLVIWSFYNEEKYRNTDQDPAVIKDLEKGEVYTLPGCEVYWTWNGEFFDGHMGERACNFISKRSGKRIFISDTLKLTNEEIWIADAAEDEDGNYIFGNKAGIPHKNIKRESLAAN